MLGESVSDPDMMEAAGITEIAGMGLLPVKTVFYGDKIQTQTSGIIEGAEGILSGINGINFTGYEIHMGRGGKTPPVLSSGNVYGSYIHGLFDAPGVADALLRSLCEIKGVDFSSLGSFDVSEYKERQYDLLAEGVRNALDMDLIYRTIGI